MNITIRQAGIDDSRLVAQALSMAIGEDMAKEYCGNNYMDVLEEIVRMEDSQYSYHHALLAMADEVPAGAIVGYDGGLLNQLRDKTLSVIHKYNPQLPIVEEETEDGEFYLDSIGVLPEFRGCGIGRKLLLAMRNKAFSSGHKCVGLLVDDENPKAERLYISLGFERVGTKMFFGHKMWHLQSQSLNK